MNKIEIKEDCAIVYFRDIKRNFRKETVMIDIEDIEKLEKFGKTFSLRKCGNGLYAVHSQTDTYLHQLIFGKVKKGNLIDHINQNSLDCRRNNLREADHSLNTLNSRATGKVGIRGIFPHSDGGFCVQVSINKKNIHVGTFKTVELAVLAKENFYKAMGV